MPAAWRARRAARRIRCSWASRPTWGGCFDPAPAVTAPRELARVLTLRDLVLIVVGTTIGSGIFTVPGAVLRQSGGDLGVALLVWLLGSVLALLGALTFGELGAMLPDAGGSYVYVRDAFGTLPAFLVGWTLFLAINSGGTATLAVAFANYLGELVPLAPAAHKLAAVAMIAAVAAVNIRGVRQAASVQNWSTALKVGALLALAVAGVALGDGFHRSDAHAFTTPLSFASFSAAGVALLGVLWAYEGWQNVTNSAGEARDPQRTFARGIGFGTAALAVAFSALWSMVLAVSGTFEQLFTYVVFASWIFAALAAASVFVLRRRRPDAPRPFRVPGYPVTPALFIAAAAAIVGNTIVARPVQALIGLGIVATGVPAYFVWKHRPRP